MHVQVQLQKFIIKGYGAVDGVTAFLTKTRTRVRGMEKSLVGSVSPKRGPTQYEFEYSRTLM